MGIFHESSFLFVEFLGLTYLERYKLNLSLFFLSVIVIEESFDTSYILFDIFHHLHKCTFPLDHQMLLMLTYFEVKYYCTYKFDYRKIIQLNQGSLFFPINNNRISSENLLKGKLLRSSHHFIVNYTMQHNSIFVFVILFNKCF